MCLTLGEGNRGQEGSADELLMDGMSIRGGGDAS